MLNIIQNTIGAIRRVGESVVRAGLKMWLPFTKAEPLGENIVINGDFATDSDWDKLNGATISDNKANITGDGTVFTSIKQDNVFVEGKVYICVFDVTITSGLGLKFQDGSNNENIGFATTSGVYTFHFTAGSDSDLVIGRRTSGTAFESYVNSVSIEEYAQETPDISGNDNNAILKTGKALVFAGNDSVETVFPSSKDIKTIAFWIYPTHTASGETLFYFGGTGQGTKFLYLNHLTLRKDSFGGMDFSVYVDGVYRGNTYETSNYVTLVQDEWQRIVLTTSTAYNTISDAFDVAYKGFGSHGRFKMSDLQIYGAEFTADDIAYDYANPQKLVTDNASSNVTLNDLHAWWHMSEGDGTIAFDSAPISNGNIDGETYDGSSLGATYDDAQERIPQLGMMNWSKGSNLIEYSEEFSNNYWDYAGVTLDSGYLAPDGTMSAYKLSADVSGSGAVNNLFSGIGSYYRSIWAKTTSGTGTVSLMTRFDSTGSIFTITNEWQRFSINSADSLADYFYVVDFRGGNLDEVVLWGAQLENADSVSAYRRTNGTTVTDATLISCATDSQKDILGNAVRVKGSGFNLDGTGYAEVLDDNDFDIPACNSVDEGAFSFMGWVKFKYELQTGSSYNVIYNNGISMTQTGTFSIASANTNKITAWVSGSFVNSITTHSHGDWVHFALTRDVNGSVKLYINKTLENTITQSYFLSNSENKKIGWDNTNGDRFYNELIDDIKLYNRELSSDEIEQNYNATKSGHNN